MEHTAVVNIVVKETHTLISGGNPLALAGG